MEPMHLIVALIIGLIVLVAVALLLTGMQDSSKGLEYDEQIKLCCQSFLARGCPDPTYVLCSNGETLKSLADKAKLTYKQLNATCGC